MARLLAILLFASGTAGLAGLGLWQLDRAAHKRERHAGYVARQSAAPLDFATLPADSRLAELEWRQVRARGHYLDRHVLLDNRLLQGRAGYEVLTPFATDDGRVVLIARGWVPLGASRDAAPDVLAPAEALTVHGHFGDVPVSGIELAGETRQAELMAPEIIRVQRVLLEALAPLLEVRLWPAVLYLAPDAPGAFAVAWPAPGDGSAKHTAYAVQWFAMAAVLGGIGLWQWQPRRRRHG